jgi:hypothetical protein
MHPVTADERVPVLIVGADGAGLAMALVLVLVLNQLRVASTHRKERQ